MLSFRTGGEFQGAVAWSVPGETETKNWITWSGRVFVCNSLWCLDGSVWVSCASFSNILLSNKGFVADLQTLTCFKKNCLADQSGVI